jgi:hypothetical protein
MNSLRERVIREYKKAWRTILRDANPFGEGKPSLLRYHQEQQRELKGYERIASEEELERIVREKDVIYIGDYHSLRGAKLNFLNLVDKGRHPDKYTMIALEEFRQSDQESLDKFLGGDIELAELLRITTQVTGRRIESGIKRILEYARDNDIEVIGIDTNESDSLKKRDTEWAKVIGRYIERSTQIFVLAGDNHVAKSHLPFKIRKLVEGVDDLVVFQNEERIFWQLMEQGIENSTSVVKVSEGSYCINHTPPLLKALVYANTSGYEDDNISNSDILELYLNRLRNILKDSLRLDYDGLGARTFTFHDIDLERKLRLFSTNACGKQFIDEEDIQKILKCARDGRSITLVEANIMYLSTDKTCAVAKETAHSLRYGKKDANPYGEGEQRVLQNFYATVLEEAIGYIGSKIFDLSKNPSDTPEIWVSLIGTGQQTYLEIVNQSQPLFAIVSHALGEELGERLYQQLEKREIGIRDITNLFKRKFEKQGTAHQEFRRIMGLN